LFQVKEGTVEVKEERWKKGTYGIGIKTTVKHPNNVFPQSIPRLLNRGLATNGIPAPIILRKKSLEARTDAAYWGYAGD
jgi:hypothetical protein